MNAPLKNYIHNTVIILDLFFLNIILLSVHYIFNENVNWIISSVYMEYWVLLNGSWIGLTFILKTYSGGAFNRFEFFIKRTAQVYLFWIIVLLFYLFFFRKFQISRGFVFITFIAFGFGLLTNRFLYLGIHIYLKKSNRLLNKVIIIGYNNTAKKLAKYFSEEGLNIDLVGFTEENKNVNELSYYPILAEIKNTVAIAKKLDVQEIFSTIPPEQNQYIYTILHEAERDCIRFKVVPDFTSLIKTPVVIDYIRDLPILSLRRDPLDNIGNQIKKRILDVAVSFLVVIFILSWLIPLLGMLILLDSKGPIFFSQQRSGKNNKKFNCLKFRSMRINPDAESKQATKFDQRVTRVGKFLRRTSLDEFPQFINVLIGEMSLVGPRPHMVKHTSDYSKIVDNFMIRQFSKPGITGWAQINGFRGQITDNQQLKSRVTSDLWYLENWTIWLDIRILFLTIYKIVKGDENAF
jgi:putative colanic acid biosynthesis UDP-glucose lipid carrier transferase